MKKTTLRILISLLLAALLASCSVKTGPVRLGTSRQRLALQGV